MSETIPSVLTTPESIRDAEYFSPGQRAWRRFRRNRLARWSAGYLALLVLLVICWPVLLKLSSATQTGKSFAKAHAPEQLSDAQFSPPDWQHWFGTDGHGR